jgi:predicted dienelactone hydrolase
MTTAPDPGQAALEVAIWYPSNDATSDAGLVAFDMDVAKNGAISGDHHPLIVMSHGTGGSDLNSFDTAVALADAGFVVVAMRHTGDNYLDRSTSFTRQEFVDRTRHVSRVIDFITNTWSGHASVDPSRIGIFGHSAGGATALIDIGGIADMRQIIAYCQESPEDWGCKEGKKREASPAQDIAVPVSGADSRIKAAVLVAPAVPAAFRPNGLSMVKVPVQLWVGQYDDYVPNASLVRTLLPTPPDYHFIPNGGHFAYLTPCNEVLARSAPEICVDPKGFDRAAFLSGFHQSVIAFYREQLK